ncbi:hypothetical protein NC661_00845 [Aquibacillus koreensis]|uniref:Uncharacterized protein n=1 Tax=Aquibacillus koreensis TaxID=279446 RepID=A0A9X3WFL4_9BACI|nr:hypothetical protein [Aquibacillus koreensis]MCT2537486.1 hypothetical protein [Aquibacillus koreensis]MDC3418932.1 hypothetical protein [Aquibacillus koreensis]
MKLIDELIQALIELVHDYNVGLIDQIELQLKLQYLISRIDKIEINYNVKPFKQLVNRKHTITLDQLLYKAKYRAVQSILVLKNVRTKNALSHQLSVLIGKNLYFESLYRTLESCYYAYINMNHLDEFSKEVELFKYKDGRSLL